MNHSDFGTRSYEEILLLQHKFVESQTEHLLVGEHPLAITVGRATGAAEDLVQPTAPVFQIERGGRATLHLPGQIVVYPIVNLLKRGWDQVQWLRILEKSTVALLEDFRLAAKVVSGKTGVWVGEKKIGSIGVAVKNNMSFHGLSLNVCCDLSQFKQLKPCGFEPEIMTSMKKEIDRRYWGTWNLTDESLLKRVRLRFTEVIEERLN